LRIDDLCRRHCTRVINESCIGEGADCIEPHEPLYMVKWDICMEDCYRVANIVLLGLGEAVVESCRDRGLYIEYPPRETWVLSCVKKHLIDMSYYSDLVAEIIDRMATYYWKVFRAFWRGQVSGSSAVPQRAE
jgi:hypothetical protein